jgi:cobalt-zinc-cadmium efflux system protein
MKGHHHIRHDRKLLITVLLNGFITLAQITGGIISGSLALISDALHNLSDSVAVTLAWMAGRLALKPRTDRTSFGFQRAEILAAFINALVLIAVSVYLVIEAVRRFVHLREVDPQWMLWLGLLGLVANGISVFILHGDRKENINLKAAYLHLAGDALTSLAVVAGAIAIRFLQWYWVDPLVTLFISGYLFIQTFSVLRESVEILMQMSPAGIDPQDVAAAVTRIEGIENVHHIHIWQLNDRKIHFEAHIVLKSDLPVSATYAVREAIKNELLSGFGIDHVTLQFEFLKGEIPGHDCLMV